MKYGDRVTGTVTGYDEKGRGSFDSVSIPFTCRGDEVAATFVKRDKGRKVLHLEDVVTAGPDRVSTPCPHAGSCGGCLWQHVAYDAQLKEKRDRINAAFEKAGHDERVDDVVPCDEPFHYRNRMDYAVGWQGTIGLKEYGSWNRYLDLSTCLLLDEETPAILEACRALMRDLPLEPWDARDHHGQFRYVVIRRGKNTGQRMITLVVSDLSRIDVGARKTIVDRLSPLCTTLLLGEQPTITDLSLVERVETLVGDPWIEEEVNGVRYRIAPNSFFQTNTDMAAKLQDRVLGLVGDPSTVLDLYCGLGFFGITLAKRIPTVRVHGFEIDAEAIALADLNATANGVADRCAFTSGPAEDLSWKDIDADVVILDPPRAGLHPRVLKTVLEKKPPHLIYVSCNYRRLVEELKDFKTAYRVESVAAFDLFPHTPHVEVVAKLVKNPSLGL
ncbi:23S rRNA (uracil(1939)-C(5))-methyltransferase RlmD [Patescibacteria group bacterium]|nr:23S rRNA (uracil(1939)-C(5))-methyltransferase RlmD [Patescibacteria group bacterium]